MVRLHGGTHFLLLRSSERSEKRHISSYRRFDEAIAKWEGLTRISPIFALEGAQPPGFGSAGASWLVFFGPIFPGSLEFAQAPDLFLSLGILNAVAFCTTEEQRAEVRAFIDSRGIFWEQWEIQQHQVEKIRSGGPTPQLQELDVADFDAPFRAEGQALLPTARECRTLLVATFARASVVNSESRDILARFARVLSGLLAGDESTLTEKSQLLANANAALSRQLWQAYAGIPPIVETPCHFATHSLLGIGTASIALEALTRFIEDVFEEADIPERIAAMSSSERHREPLISVLASDSFWHEDHIMSPPSRRTVPLDPSSDPPLPHLTYFSGRDGFRSSVGTVSASAEAINACNTSSWTLQTITHELSHSVIRSIMGQLLPDPGNTAEIYRILGYIRDPSTTPNLHAQLSEFLTHALWAMEGLEGPEYHQMFSAAELGVRLRRNWGAADEILTHIFDFLYHYRSDAETYIKAIWASWAQIPHIESRVSDYVTRSLCAIHTLNLRREHSLETTIESLCNCLERVRVAFPDALYIPEAIAILTQDRLAYASKLNDRIPLIKFAKGFLYSPTIAKTLSTPGESTPNEAKLFSDDRIGNPLRFVEDWSQNEKSDPLRSIWILQYLAYGRGQ